MKKIEHTFTCFLGFFSPSSDVDSELMNPMSNNVLERVCDRRRNRKTSPPHHQMQQTAHDWKLVGCLQTP
eukprot:3484215-Amphidinium_carterae.1